MIENLFHSVGLGNLAIGVFVGIGLIAPMRMHVTKSYGVTRDAWSAVSRILTVCWATCLIWRSASLCNEHFSSGIPWLVAVENSSSTHVCLPYAGLAAYCVAQLAFYVAEIDFLYNLPSSEWRKDDRVLIAHHFITIFLIGVYALLGTQILWVCTLATALHDISDIFVDGAKAWRKTHPRVSAVLFYVFALSWIVLRLYYIPFVLIYGMITDPRGPKVPLAYVGLFIILLLQCAQVYWTFLIGLVIKRQLTSGGKLEDTRESS